MKTILNDNDAKNIEFVTPHYNYLQKNLYYEQLRLKVLHDMVILIRK